MTRLIATLATVVLLASTLVSPAWAAGGKIRGDKATGPAGATGEGLVNTNRGAETGTGFETLGTLSEEEAGYILYMREEEKLARDVYLTLYDYYIGQDPIQARIFDNISTSEQRHMDALGRLIDKYGLEDPVVNDEIGAFSNPDTDFADLYEDLVTRGKNSYCEALNVGVEIEDLDIEDIESSLGDVTAQDVNRVFSNLLNGSYNHLNAFTSRIESNCQ